MEVITGALEAVGPWISTIAPLPLLFIALVRGWLLTPASVQRIHESQETRIAEMKASYESQKAEMKENYEARLADSREREQEWKDKTTEALAIVQAQTRQLDVVTELGETSVKLMEAVHGARFGYNPEEQKSRITHVVRPGREG